MLRTFQMTLLYRKCVFVTESCQEQPADLVFLLDASYSIWIPDFNRELSFVTNLLTAFDVGPDVNQTHVGVLTFGHGVWPQFYFNTHNSKCFFLG